MKKQLIISNFFKDNQLNTKSIITKYVIILENASEMLSSRFSQFCRLESTLEFLINPHIIKFDELKLSFLEWLNIENLTIEIIEFQGSYTWRNKFIDLNNAGK